MLQIVGVIKQCETGIVDRENLIMLKFQTIAYTRAVLIACFRF